MKKTIVLVLIALHFAKMKVVELLPFARSIHDNAGADPNVTIDPATLVILADQITLLSGTVTLRETNKSLSLTTLEGTQATDVILTITDIASSAQKQANAIEPGNTGRATLAIQRIGFAIQEPHTPGGRFFKIFKAIVGAASVRVKRDILVSLYHWRVSLDGTTWIRLPDTKVVSIVVTGLPSVKVVFFQSAQTMKSDSTATFDIVSGFEPVWSDSITVTMP